MNAQTRKCNFALASLFVLGALGFMGCGTAGQGGGQAGPGPGTDPAVPPPAETLPFPPVAGFAIFDPQTEEELRGEITEGALVGNPIVNYGYMIAKVKASFDPEKFAQYGLEVKGAITANGARYYFLHKDSDNVATMRKVRQELAGALMFIEPDVAHYLDFDPVPFSWATPDPYVANQQQHGVLVTQTLKAWQEFGFGPHRAVVCDIDTGVNFAHEDLTNTVRHAYTWYTDDGTALLPGITGNPYDDQDPVDMRVSNPSYPSGTDPDTTNAGHGTHTAGTIAAEGGNGKGVAGMCWNVDLVHYKMFRTDGASYTWTGYGSLWHLVKWKQANNYPYTIPVNMSFGGVAPSQFAADMIEMALQNGVMCCASSGNDYGGIANQKWPSAYTGVMSVGATYYNDRRVLYSNWGTCLSVVAPGYYVYSTNYTGTSGYVLMGGTSMATPHVTGLAGYMLTFNKDLKPDQIRTLIEQNCDPIDGQNGFSVHTGWGRINTYKTIKAVLAGGTPPSNYVLAPIKVRVEDSSHNLLNNATVYLYNCNQDGSITNYAGCTISGYSYVDVRKDPDLEMDGEDGVAYFDGLKPGYYKVAAKCAVTDIGTGTSRTVTGSGPVFQVSRGMQPAETTVTMNFTPLTIQTLPTSNTTRQGGDTRIRVHNSLAGGAIISQDTVTYDTVICMMPTTPGTYWIQVIVYGNAYGEYALNLSTNGARPWPAPGTFDDPGTGGVKGGETTARTADSQLIEVNGPVVYGDMTLANRDSGDWYRFVVP